MTFDKVIQDTPFSEMQEVDIADGPPLWPQVPRDASELVEDKEFSDDDYFLDIEGNFD